MRTFNAETDSVYLQKWYVDLASDPVEFENLFTKPLRNLAGLAAWMVGDIKFFFESDKKGIWFAAWITPMFTDGAEVGAWIRKDKRGSRAALAAIDEFYDGIVLAAVPCLIGLTRQYPALHDLHLKLGYVYVDEFPGVFDGHSVWMYKMTRETRAGRVAVQQAFREKRRAAYGSRRREIEQPEQSVESLRGNVGEIRGLGPESRRTRLEGIIESGKRVASKWWSNQPDPDHQPPG